MAESSLSNIAPDSLCMSVMLSELEADLAYCDARITLIGNDPDTPYQRAQLKAFRILEQQLAAALAEQKQALELMREQ
ncbi:MAG: hypothetical protein HQL47_00805 [Gammaproteobacteria bacterium]|nr:hypothetical protein [Gammaproteobacteria bacterium]